VSPLRLLHIVGARPQFAKAAAVWRAVEAHNAAGTAPLEQRLLHTGQHYDPEMSQVFFDELGLAAPDYHLAVGSGDSAYQTAAALQGIYAVLGEWAAGWVVVYGDTNATLAGGIAAQQRHLRLAHIEAGVRTGRLHQAEELNRVVVDRISDLRCCCTRLNLANLATENLVAGSHFTGDTMLDNYRAFLPRMDNSVLERCALTPGTYVLCTVHRAENTDVPGRLNSIARAIALVQREQRPVVLPLHPRTRAALERGGLLAGLLASGVCITEPLGFNAVQALLEHCHCVLTDSGGLQREAYFAGRFSVIPWEFASWPELVEAGWVSLGGVEPQSLAARIAAAPGPQPPEREGLFGDGAAGAKIAALLAG
jgi:UDP-N-acetylglucosamine 2-epimerase